MEEYQEVRAVHATQNSKYFIIESHLSSEFNIVKTNSKSNELSLSSSLK